jgi:hypothetical protein
MRLAAPVREEPSRGKLTAFSIVTSSILFVLCSGGLLRSSVKHQELFYDVNLLDMNTL